VAEGRARLLPDGAAPRLEPELRQVADALPLRALEPPGVRMLDPREDLEPGRLPRTVRPDQPHAVAIPEEPVAGVEQERLAEGPSDAGGPDQVPLPFLPLPPVLRPRGAIRRSGPPSPTAPRPPRDGRPGGTARTEASPDSPGMASIRQRGEGRKHRGGGLSLPPAPPRRRRRDRRSDRTAAGQAARASRRRRRRSAHPSTGRSTHSWTLSNRTWRLTGLAR